MDLPLSPLAKRSLRISPMPAAPCSVNIQMPRLEAFRQPISRVQAAGENLPFASKTFDVIRMIEVLEKTHRDTKVLEECFRILISNREACEFFLFRTSCTLFESHPCSIASLSIGPNIPLVSSLPAFLLSHLCPSESTVAGNCSRWRGGLVLWITRPDTFSTFSIPVAVPRNLPPTCKSACAFPACQVWRFHLHRLPKASGFADKNAARSHVC